MKRRLKEPFGKAGLTVAICALVLGLIGGAYAAGGLTKSQEKQVKRIAKKYAGKPGATGPAGPAGTNGTNGAPGKNGAIGKDGANGQDGSPWTAGGTLPKGSTETGSWSFSAGTENTPFASLGFTIPLKEKLEASEVHYVSETGDGTTCPGSAANPQAQAGNLCVYQSFAAGVKETAGLAKGTIVSTGVGPFLLGAGTGGAGIVFEGLGTETALGFGTWAVTGK